MFKNKKKILKKYTVNNHEERKNHIINNYGER